MTSRNKEWLLLAGFALVGLLAGLASGSGAFAVVVVLALYIARQAWITRRLARTLQLGQRLEPPFPGGPWQEIFAALRRLQARSRKRKQRLRRFVSRFQDAAAALPDAVVILGRENRVEWRNPAARRLLGLQEKDCLGAPITTRIRDPVFLDFLASGNFDRALEMPAPGNRSIMLSVLVTPFGRRRQQVLVARDITRTYHLDQTRKDFVANVSHELRTPLTVLSGHLEMLAGSGEGDAPAPGAMDSMRGNVERMRVLLDDLLTLSRLEMGRVERTETSVDVHALLASILQDSQVLASGTRHVLNLESDSELRLRGSTAELHSAFANLVNNAIKHTPPRTDIEIRWYADDAGAYLVVSDNGQGIPGRHLPRLTERFYRVDASRSSHSGGTGLGLAIVKHVLEQHDATLGVESREGAGTTFECRFPRARIEAASSMPPTQAAT